MGMTLSNRGRWGLAGLALLILLPAAAAASGSPFLIGVVTRFLIYGLAAVSLDLVIGYGAMVSFGHAMFFGLGGYAVGIIAFHTSEAGPIFGWAGSNAALVVWPIALACARWLAGSSAGAAHARRAVHHDHAGVRADGVFHPGVAAVLRRRRRVMISARNTLPGINLESPLVFYYVCLALLTAWTLLCMRITSSRFGMVLQALRQSERRALNLGVAPTPYRLGAFVLSAVGTGLAGVLWANYAGLVTPDMAAWTKSGELMAIVILGGVGCWGRSPAPPCSWGWSRC